MEFKERLNLVNEILRDCPYETQKQKLTELFEITKNSTKSDIMLRLILIDSCYSTNMNKRLFGFEELTNLILKIEPQLDENIDVKKFVEKNYELLVSKVGIDKKGNSTKHACSLITKYIYFRTKFSFPIYDRLVFNELKEEKLIKLPQKPSITYFKILVRLKNNYSISFDDLDKYFWVCGKVREGSLSLLIPDKNSYQNDFLNKLNIDKIRKINSNNFNKELSKIFVSEKELFQDSKLRMIQRLAKSIKNEKVFVTLNITD